MSAMITDSGATPSAVLRLGLVNEKGEARITPQLVERLLLELEHTAPRVVVLEGDDQAFSLGLDVVNIESINENETARCLARFEHLLATLRDAQFPVIAKVNGPALGGGVGLASVADLVLASSNASFALPETLLGLIPAVVFPYVSARIGVTRARLMGIGYRPLTAREGFELGLVDEVCYDVELALQRDLKRFLLADPTAVAKIKTLSTLQVDTIEHRQTYHHEALAAFSELLHSDRTQGRLLRFARGETPWGDDAEPRIGGEFNGPFTPSGQNESGARHDRKSWNRRS